MSILKIKDANGDWQVIEVLKGSDASVTSTSIANALGYTPANADHNHALAELSEKSYNSLTDKPTIPTKISDLTNDSTFLTQHQDISGKANSSDLATVATSGNYTDLLNKPSIPGASSSASIILSTTWTTATASTTPSDSICDYYQNVSVTGVTVNNNVIVGLASTATTAQRVAAEKAKLFAYSQGANSLVLCVSDGATMPTIEIPISIVILG